MARKIFYPVLRGGGHKKFPVLYPPLPVIKTSPLNLFSLPVILYDEEITTERCPASDIYNIGTSLNTVWCTWTIKKA